MKQPSTTPPRLIWKACIGIAASSVAFPADAQRLPLSACERTCGAALVECLQDDDFDLPRGKRKAYRVCRQRVLGSCEANGEASCPVPATTTTTTLPAVPAVSLNGDWDVELDLIEVYGCTRPSLSATFRLFIQQTGTTLSASTAGYGGRLRGYRGELTPAGFALAVQYKRRIGGKRCRASGTIQGLGFDEFIPVVVRTEATCGRLYCAGSFEGTLSRPISDE